MSDRRQASSTWFQSVLAVASIIGLALSVASFADGLKMVQDIWHFVVTGLERVETIRDAVVFLGSMVHGVLEWWRGIVAYLISFLPFVVPKWLHDPISIALFALARAASVGSSVFRGLFRTYWEREREIEKGTGKGYIVVDWDK